jgi:hypothetical protein
MMKEGGWINVAKNESQILLLNLVLTPALLHCTALDTQAATALSCAVGSMNAKGRTTSFHKLAHRPRPRLPVTKLLPRLIKARKATRVRFEKASAEKQELLARCEKEFQEKGPQKKDLVDFACETAMKHSVKGKGKTTTPSTPPKVNAPPLVPSQKLPTSPGNNHHRQL